ADRSDRGPADRVDDLVAAARASPRLARGAACGARGPAVDHLEHPARLRLARHVVWGAFDLRPSCPDVRLAAHADDRRTAPAGDAAAAAAGCGHARDLRDPRGGVRLRRLEDP